MFNTFVTKVLQITLVYPPSLNLSHLLRPQLLISNISQIQFSTTSGRTGLNTVCTCRLGEQKQQHPNIFFHKKKYESRENNSVCCAWLKVLLQATDNRFMRMKAWAELHSVPQRLLSMKKVISLPVL